MENTETLIVEQLKKMLIVTSMIIIMPCSVMLPMVI